MAYIDREVAIKTAVTNAKINNQFDAVILVEAMEDIPTADVVEVKQIEIIRDDLKWWLETNTEKGVVFIPEFVVENMIAKMDGKEDA